MENLRYDVSYLRLSLADDDGKDESNSITSQRKCIQDYWQTQESGRELSEYVDDGYSGTNFERPAFQRMLMLVKKGQVRTLIVKDLSRLGRNYLEVGYFMEYVFPYYGVRVVSINDRFDSKKAADSTGGLEIALKNLMNECYSRDISRKISSAVHVKKMSGEYCYGAVPFGYKKGALKNTIVPDEAAANTVRYIFRLACEGHTITQIARRLNEEQVTTPSKYLSRPNYRIVEHWSYESVRNILQNRIYTGDTECYKSHVKKVGSNQVRQIPEADRPVVENTHEALVSREDYQKAKEVVKSNVKAKKSCETSPLTGLLVCGCCGNRLIKGKSINKSFLCSNKRYRPDSDCKDVRAVEKATMDILQRAINTQVALLEEQERELRTLLKDNQSEILICQRELARLSDKKKRLSEQRLTLYEGFLEGKITKAEYLAKKASTIALEEDCTGQQAVIDLKLKELQDKQENKARQCDQAFPLSAVKSSTELTRDLLFTLVDKVVVMPDGALEIFWKFRDEMEVLLNE